MIWDREEKGERDKEREERERERERERGRISRRRVSDSMSDERVIVFYSLLLLSYSIENKKMNELKDRMRDRQTDRQREREREI
jgi:hypothetical protein